MANRRRVEILSFLWYNYHKGEIKMLEQININNERWFDLASLKNETWKEVC